MRKLILLILLTLPLQGCLLGVAKFSLSSLNQAGYCPVHLHKKVAHVRNFMTEHAQSGIPAEHVASTLGKPDVRTTLVLNSGAQVDVWDYNIHHPNCRGLNGGSVAQIVFQRGVLIGAGDVYFERYIRPYIREQQVAKLF